MNTINKIKNLSKENSGKSIAIPILPLNFYQKLIEENGGIFKLDEIDTNGWEIDFEVPLKIFDNTFTLRGSLVYGGYTIYKD